MDWSDFKDKVVLVTGGNAGIGRATAEAFARQGAKVVITARREKEGRETADFINDQGGRAIFVASDVTDGESVGRMVQKAVSEYGRLDIAFNNAGTAGGMTLLADMEEADFDRVVNLNLKGVWWCMKHQIPAMLQSGGGAIVNCSSVAAFKSQKGVSVYSASKAAVVAMTRSAAVDYADKGIRINAVAPAVIETELARVSMRLDDEQAMKKVARAHPMGRIGQPREVVEAVLWLSSEASSFVTGHTLAVDGGLLAV